MYIVPERQGVLHRRGEPRGETVSAFEARSERLVRVRAQTFPIPGDIPAVPGCRLSSVQVPTAGSTPLAPRRADRHVRVVGVPAADHQPGFALRERDDPLAELLTEWADESLDVEARAPLVDALPTLDATAVEPSKWQPAANSSEMESKVNQTIAGSVATIPR